MNLSLLLAAALCFPSVPDLWKGGPLTDEVMKLPSAPVFAPDQQEGRRKRDNSRQT